MKIKFLLLGTSLSLIPNLTFAQCVATQDCATLGYTETSCNGGKGVKCPFGNWWACLPTKESICKEEGFTLACNETGQIGSGDSCGGLYKKCTCTSPYIWNNGACTCDSIYQYTCSGTGYSGGSGTSCGDKYAACNCTSGYEWKNGNCQQKIINGADGDVYKCNGIVVGVKTSGMNFYVAMNDLSSMSWTSAKSACAGYIFCGNFKGSLPTLEQLKSIHNNKVQINTLLSTNGGAAMKEDHYWSSSYVGLYGGHYILDMFNGDVFNFNGIYGDNTHYTNVRPVLTSW